MGRRDTRILALLSERGRMDVATLAEELHVSQVTMRKDLDGLADRRLVRREHGFAELGSTNDVAGRLAYHYAQKVSIARRAAELVSDGETVMIESGSCCALMARALFEGHHDVTVITNSAFIAAYVRDLPGADVMLLAGTYQMDAQVTVGPLVRTSVASLSVDKLFVGTDGYSADSGFTNADALRAQAVHDMAERAANVYVVTESEKFLQRGVVSLDLSGRPVHVVTDRAIDGAAREELVARGIELLYAREDTA